MSHSLVQNCTCTETSCMHALCYMRIMFCCTGNEIILGNLVSSNHSSNNITNWKDCIERKHWEAAIKCRSPHLVMSRYKPPWPNFCCTASTIGMSEHSIVARNWAINAWNEGGSIQQAANATLEIVLRTEATACPPTDYCGTVQTSRIVRSLHFLGVDSKRPASSWFWTSKQ